MHELLGSRLDLRLLRRLRRVGVKLPLPTGGQPRMNSTNNFSQLELLVAQGHNASPSAEDQYLTQVDEQAELAPIHFPVGERYTRTVHHHYRLATITVVERVITSARRNSTIHVYH
jgi:hypothetical protein